MVLIYSYQNYHNIIIIILAKSCFYYCDKMFSKTTNIMAKKKKIDLEIEDVNI